MFPANGKGMSVLILVERRPTLAQILTAALALVTTNGTGTTEIDPSLDRVAIEFIKPKAMMVAKRRRQ